MWKHLMFRAGNVSCFVSGFLDVIAAFEIQPMISGRFLDKVFPWNIIYPPYPRK